MTHAALYLTAFAAFIIPAYSAQIGASPSQVMSPTAYRELKRQTSDQGVSTTGQVNAQGVASAQRIAKLATKLDTLASKLEAFKVTLADKDMSRVAALETKEAVRTQADQERERQRTKEHDEFMWWVHLIAGTAGSIAVGIGIQMLKSAKSEARHSKEVGLVASKVEIVDNRVYAVQKQTNGMLESAKDECFRKGRLMGIAEEKMRTELREDQ